jgi:hypothetical protein
MAFSFSAVKPVKVALTLTCPLITEMSYSPVSSYRSVGLLPLFRVLRKLDGSFP